MGPMLPIYWRQGRGDLYGFSRDASKNLCLAQRKDRLMSVKLVVLYPKPTDPEAFESYYHSQHLPLMRRLVGPDIPLPTYRVTANFGAEPPFYRVAEIHFPDRSRLDAFLRADPSGVGRASAIKVSSGGLPSFFLCEAD